MGKGSVVLALLVAVVGFAALGHIGSLLFDTDGDYDITYELDGGSLPDGCPTHYYAGEYLDLPAPSKDGCYFMGWFEDRNYTKPIGAVSKTDERDLTLYALWSDVNPMGSVFDLGTHMGKVVSVKVTGYSEGIGCTYRAIYGEDDMVFNMSDGSATYVGNDTASGYLCSLWSLDGIILWIYCGVPLAVSIGDDTIVDDDPGYRIDYVLAGGTLPEGSRAEYMWGGYLDLPVPVKDGSYFEGWYTDPAFMEPVGAITSDLYGELTLYAKWYGNDPVGMQYKYGGILYSMLTYEEGRVFTVISQEGCDDLGFWTFGEDITYVGNETIGGVVCSAWEVGQYKVYYDSIKPKAISSGSLTNNMTYWSPMDVPVPMVLFDEDSGAALTGGTIALGKSATFTSTFDVDWMVDGVKVSDSSSFKVDMIMPWTVYRASTDTVRDVAFDVKPSELGIGDTVTVYDGSMTPVATGDVTTVSFDLDPGLYLAVGGDSSPFTSLAISVGKTLTFNWTYDGDPYTLTLSMDYGDVAAYAESYGEYDRVYRYYEGNDTDEVYAAYVDKFVTIDDVYVKEVSQKLLAMRGTMDDIQFASLVLHFVGSIEYKSDFETHGVNEYYKFPAEMLWEKNGDCEDAVLLYVTLMSLLGYDTGIITLPNHAMAILDIGTYNSNGFDHEGKWYTYCEATNTFDVGEMGYDPDTGSLNSVNETDIEHKVFIDKVIV